MSILREIFMLFYQSFPATSARAKKQQRYHRFDKKGNPKK
jgi:hypothetical protein